MKHILKMQWNNKTVKVALCASFTAYHAANKMMNLYITAEETTLLPSRFVRGQQIKANPDIVQTVGGLPRYINKVLNTAAQKEQKRRAKPIKQQLTLRL